LEWRVSTKASKKRPKRDRGPEQQAGRGEIWCIEKLEKEGNTERPLFKAKSTEVLAYLALDWFK
jgi:hypothetical protein